MSAPRRAERYLPLGYFAAALLLVVALLPSVLRQAPPETNQTAEFSPDAPPDEEEQAIISSLSRATSGTAGAGEGTGPGEASAGGKGGGAGRAVVKCRGYGNPPRQTLSLYAAPCVPPFKGTNPGATAHGVTATEIRVAVYALNTDTSPDGFVDTPAPQNSETALRRDLRTFQTYFNRTYNFHGRQLRFVLLHATLGTDGGAEGRAVAQRAKNEFQVFGAIDFLYTNHGLADESMRLGIVMFNGQHSKGFHNRHAPYSWSWMPSLDDALNLGGELICKQFAGKPPSLNHRMDTQFDYSKPRKWGMFVYEDANHSDVDDIILSAIEACGVTVNPIIRYNLAEDIYQGDIGGAAMAQFRANGVTSIISIFDPLAAGYILGQAESASYYPEWIHMGLALMDTNAAGRGANQNQWQNAVGLSFNEIERGCQYYDEYRAFRTVEPEALYVCRSPWVWGALEQFANGLQMAGPFLNPTTFERGLFKMPRRDPNPTWALGGGFGSPSDRTYVQWATLQWWDKKAIAADKAVGAYRHLFEGRRFRAGGLPTDPLPFQVDGITTPANPDPHPEDRTERDAT